VSLTPLNLGEIRYPGFTRKRRKFYLISEVDALLARVCEQIELERKALKEARDQNSALREKNDEQSQSVDNLLAEAAERERVIAGQADDISGLGSVLDKIKAENADLSERAERQKAELAQLNERVSQLSELLEDAQRKSSEVVLEEAARKANQIINRAVVSRDQMLSQANDQRTRLISACRAAYYNSLQFKQDLAEQFRRMEQDLDESIDVLRKMDAAQLTVDPFSSMALEGGDPPE